MKYDPKVLDEMMVQTELNSCKDCRHAGHSGAFTEGGAQLLCDHPNAPKNRNSKWNRPLLNPSAPTEFPKDIPDWCPLKHGAKY